jgi:ABC-2 type transport system ATP-binding protein
MPSSAPTPSGCWRPALEVPVRLEAIRRRCPPPVSDPQRVAHALSELAHAGIEVANFALGQPSLDEVFLTLTGHPAEDQTVEPPAAGPQPAEEVAP